MASTTTEAEASEIRRRGRRRLIGAVVLVGLLVVFVPMLLDSEPRPSRSPPVAAIPSKDKVAPLPPPKAAPAPAVAPAKAGAQSPTQAAGIPSPTPATVSVVPAPDAALATPVPPRSLEKAQADPPPVKTASAPPSAAQAGKAADAPKLEGFAVQVGAFRDEAKLQQSREKLAEAGVVHYTERLEAKAGPITRLRAGPFASRQEAEAALAKLKLSAIDGKVVPLP